MRPIRGKTPRKTPRRAAPQKDTDPVEVYCRIRPVDVADDDKCVKIISSNTVQLSPPDSSQNFKNGQYKETQYTFKLVIDEVSSQKTVFDTVAFPLVDDLLHGKNGLLFAYGITSSGKTHTMTGTPQDGGVLPRCLDVIFNSIGDLQAKKYVFKPDKMNLFDIQSDADAMMERQRRDLMPKLMTPKTPGRTNSQEKLDHGGRVRELEVVSNIEEDNVYAVFVSYTEIYNNYVYDLLEDLPYDPITGYKAPQSKVLREDNYRNMFVHNVTEVEVKSTEEAYDVLLKGAKRRKVAHTALNTESSRSHSVFNIRLVQSPLDPIGEEVLLDKERLCVSQLSLVDLAGSERCGRTKNAGDRLKEAGNINQSLMVLRTCIELLRENQQTGSNKMVPYRDSRVTHLFKNYFDGEGKVRMIVCINPKADEYDETVHVMRFAELTQEVQVARPQQVRFDLGMTPGRRKINEQCKNLEKQLINEGVDPDKVLMPRVYDMGPPFPILELFHADDTVTLPNVLEYLHQRQLRKQNLLTDLNKKQNTFRSKLVEMDHENKELRQRVLELEAYVNTRDSDKSRIEKRLKNSEEQNRRLQQKCTSYEMEVQELQHELEAKGVTLKKARTEKERLKMDYENKLSENNRIWGRQMERTRKDLELECGAEVMNRERKLQLLKEIVNDQATPPLPKVRPTRTPKVAPPVAPKPHYTPGRIQQAKSDTALNTTTYRNTPTTTRRAKSPPPKPAPTATIKHRRSRSQGNDLWLDHKPEGDVRVVGTLLQPKMKKKKSVSKLEIRDTKDADKYCLTHHLADSNGGIATQLIKGDVMPTVGGGAAVVFKDVETLKQTSPGDRKRRYSQPRPEDFDGEWTDTEERCNVAIEGHGVYKRTRQSRV